MAFVINNKTIETNEQGFLHNRSEWSEQFATAVAKQDGIELFVDHWELIWYFRDSYDANKVNPTMHTIVRQLGKIKGTHFHDQKEYEKHIYHLFPTDPIHEICKLAGLPMAPPDT